MAKTRQKTKIALDVVLTLLIVFEMFIQYTGNFLHEVMGFVFFATIVVHLVFASTWMKSTAQAIGKGKLSGRRRANLVLDIALAVVMVVLVVSSLAISDILYQAGFVMPGIYEVWSVLHTMSSYMLCVLVVGHLALHWVFMASAFKVPYNPARRQAIGSGVQVAAALGMLALGVNGGRALLLEDMPEANGQEAINSEGAGSGSANSSSTSTNQAPSSAPNQIPSETIQDTPYAAPQTQEQGTYTAKHQKGKGHKRQSMEADSAEGAVPESDAGSSHNSNAAPEAATPEAAAPDTPAPEESVNTQDTWEEPQENWDTGTETEDSWSTGVCTLCRKNCSFSNLRCDRPYAEGLL